MPIAREYTRAKEAFGKAHIKQKFQYDKRRQPVKLKVGDLVLWKHDKIVDPTARHVPKNLKLENMVLSRSLELVVQILSNLNLLKLVIL